MGRCRQLDSRHDHAHSHRTRRRHCIRLRAALPLEQRSRRIRRRGSHRNTERSAGSRQSHRRAERHVAADRPDLDSADIGDRRQRQVPGAREMVGRRHMGPVGRTFQTAPPTPMPTHTTRAHTPSSDSPHTVCTTSRCASSSVRPRVPPRGCPTCARDTNRKA